MATQQVVTFRSDVVGVNAQRGHRVTIKSGVQYALVETRDSTRDPKQVAVAVESPDEKYLGGATGKVELPCTIWTQVPRDAISVK